MILDAVRAPSDGSSTSASDPKALKEEPQAPNPAVAESYFNHASNAMDPELVWAEQMTSAFPDCDSP